MILFSLCLQEYQKLLDTNVQGKVNTYPKMKGKYCNKGVVSCKNMQILVW